MDSLVTFCASEPNSGRNCGRLQDSQLVSVARQKTKTKMNRDPGFSRRELISGSTSCAAGVAPHELRLSLWLPFNPLARKRAFRSENSKCVFFLLFFFRLLFGSDVPFFFSPAPNLWAFRAEHRAALRSEEEANEVGKVTLALDAPNDLKEERWSAEARRAGDENVEEGCATPGQLGELIRSGVGVLVWGP